MLTLLCRQYLRHAVRVILSLGFGNNYENAICGSVFVSNMLSGSVMSLFMRKRKKSVQMCAFVRECVFTHVLIHFVQFLVLDVNIALVCDIAF